MKQSEKQFIKEYRESFINISKDERPICLQCSDEKLIACMNIENENQPINGHNDKIGCLEFISQADETED